MKEITSDYLESDVGFQDKPLSRGVAGRPLGETPSLIGAKRGHIQCDVNVDSLAYWNSPQGARDAEFRSPFAVEVSPVIAQFGFELFRFRLIRRLAFPG